MTWRFEWRYCDTRYFEKLSESYLRQFENTLSRKLLYGITSRTCWFEKLFKWYTGTKILVSPLLRIAYSYLNLSGHRKITYNAIVLTRDNYAWRISCRKSQRFRSWTGLKASSSWKHLTSIVLGTLNKYVYCSSVSWVHPAITVSSDNAFKLSKTFCGSYGQ